MARIWNTTGLYKASKDRPPAKRSRSVSGSIRSDAVLVIPDYAERNIAEATGQFHCERKADGRQELMCQRPCDDCWKLRSPMNNSPIGEK